MRTISPLLLALAGLAIAACSPYDPALSDRPFTCGANEPKCPDGFEATGTNPCVCTRPAGGGGNDCDDDYEPNNVTTQAFRTPVGAGSSTVTLTDPILCPATDIDTYSFNTTGGGAVASITFDSSLGTLGVNIVAADGTPLATGVTSGNQSQATVNSLTTGTYYVQVVSAGGGQGPYTLAIQLIN
jgi:hypothetical protein